MRLRDVYKDTLMQVRIMEKIILSKQEILVMNGTPFFYLQKGSSAK